MPNYIHIQEVTLHQSDVMRTVGSISFHLSNYQASVKLSGWVHLNRAGKGIKMKLDQTPLPYEGHLTVVDWSWGLGSVTYIQYVLRCKCFPRTTRAYKSTTEGTTVQIINENAVYLFSLRHLKSIFTGDMTVLISPYLVSGVLKSSSYILSTNR